MIREFKEYEKKRTSYQRPKAPVAFRKETKTEDQYRQERRQKEEEAQALSKQESKNFSLARLYKTYENSKTNTNTSKLVSKIKQVAAATKAERLPPILLVDGYNLLLAWDRTSKFFNSASTSSGSSTSGSTASMHPTPLYNSTGTGEAGGGGGGGAGDGQEARDILLEAMCVYSQARGVRVVVAFDALGNPAATTTDEQLLKTGVTVVYCGDREADTYIEEQVQVWLDRGHEYVVVATSDVAQQAVVLSKKSTLPNGHHHVRSQMVHVVPASGLCKDIERTERELSQGLLEGGWRSGGPHVQGVLGAAVKYSDRKVFDALAQMRLGGGWVGAQRETGEEEDGDEGDDNKGKG